MHTKVAYASAADDPGLEFSIIDPSEGVKTASFLPEIARFFEHLKPDPAYLYVHTNAMGRSEYYGSNANSDWYGYNEHLDFDGLMHVPEDFGIDPARDIVRCKDWAYGYPSFYNATFYANHKNTDPKALGFGDVAFVTHNTGMKRIELVLRMSKAEARAKGKMYLIDKIRRGEKVDVSMGCKVPFDACSICTDWETVRKARAMYAPKKMKHWGIAVLIYHHKIAPIRGIAPSPKDWCQCMKAGRNTVLPSGQKTFVYNDLPRFFDISAVWVGADRTACVMYHLDTPDAEMPSDQPFSIQKPDPMQDALQILGLGMKTAADTGIDKEIPGGFTERVLGCDANSDITPAVSAMQKNLPLRTILSSLASSGILLRPREFQHSTLTAMGEDPGAPQYAGKIFSSDSNDVDDGLAIRPGVSRLSGLIGMLAPMRSSHIKHLHSRVLQDGSKVAYELPLLEEIQDPVLDKVAALYNGYRLSAFEKADEILDSAQVGADLTVKSAGIGALMAAGAVAPMVHWMASNLRERQRQGENLGMMSSFVASAPTTTSVLLIGVALRAQMALQKSKAAAGKDGAKPQGIRGALKNMMTNAADVL